MNINFKKNLIRELRSLGTALSFFTRIPITIKEPYWEGSIFYLPFIGLFLGTFLFLGAQYLHRLDPWFLSALLLFFQYFMANYFHFDGLVDTFDALSVVGSKEERLKILKSPEIGVLGFLWAFFFLIIELILLKEILYRELYTVLLFKPLAGRLSLLLALFLGSPAKKQGLGALFLKKKLLFRFLIAQLLWILLFFFFRFSTFILLFVTLFLLWFFQLKFGGLTGDLLGAIEEIGEGSFLCACFLLGQN